MPCPLCSYDLQSYRVSSLHGKNISVFHCGTCDGTWFDGEQIVHLPHHEVVRIVNMTVKSKRPHFTTHSFTCPYDHKPMVVFKSETVPQGISLFHCPKCKGIWATQRSVPDIVHEEEKSFGQTDPNPSPAHAFPMVFIPTLIFFFLFVSTFITIQHMQEAQETRTKAVAVISSTQIRQLSPTMAALTFTTNSPVMSSISYGTSIVDKTVQDISNTPQLNHRIVLTDLKPGTIYRYTLTVSDTTGHSYTTPEYVFTTSQ